MAKPVAEFFVLVRSFLGDRMGASGSYRYRDQQITDAIHTLFTSGLMPDTVTWDVGAGEMDPEPPNADTVGYIALKAALLLLGPAFTGGWRTRAVSVRADAQGKRMHIENLEEMVGELEAEGNVWGAGENSLYSLEEDLIAKVVIPQAASL